MQVPARVGNRTPKQPRRSTTYGKGNAVRNQQAQAMAPKRYLETQAQGKLSSVALETLQLLEPKWLRILLLEVKQTKLPTLRKPRVEASGNKLKPVS